MLQIFSKVVQEKLITAPTHVSVTFFSEQCIGKDVEERILAKFQISTQENV
jgi:hypothetical protein